jgi:hypothetical protein
MAKKKAKVVRPGIGAKGNVLTKFIYPKLSNNDPQHRSDVVLVGQEEMTVNKKTQDCYTFSLIGGPPGIVYHAAKRYVKLVKEGDRSKRFDEVDSEDDEEFEEPKVTWRNSRAKEVLYTLIMDEVVPLEAKDCNNRPTMAIKDIYNLHDEFKKYDIDKFAGRLKAIRDKIKELNSRADEDLVAFKNYKQNHAVSMYSHKGYIQWQGSDAQKFLLMDIEAGKHNELKPKVLWESRRAYMDTFPLHVFRSKLEQEIRTAKYIHTVKVRGIEHRAS